CLGGGCAFTACKANFADCEANPNHDCETPINTPDACGQCGNTCAFGNQHPFCAGNTCACNTTSCATCNEQHKEVVADVVSSPNAPGKPAKRLVQLTGFARSPNAQIDVQVLRHLAFPDGQPPANPADNPASCLADWFTLTTAIVSASTPEAFNPSLYRWSA